MGNKDTIMEKLELFSLSDGGIGNWLSRETDDEVFVRLAKIDEDPLTKVQLNQLLAFGHEASLSDGFFRLLLANLPRQASV